MFLDFTLKSLRYLRYRIKDLNKEEINLLIDLI